MAPCTDLIRVPCTNHLTPGTSAHNINGTSSSVLRYYDDEQAAIVGTIETYSVGQGHFYCPTKSPPEGFVDALVTVS